MTISQEELKKEIELCQKLYPAFEEDSKVLKAVLDGESKFYQQNPKAVHPIHYSGTAEQIKRKFIDGHSLAMGGVEIKASSFKNLLLSIAGEMVNSLPEMKEGKKELEDYLSSAFPVGQEKVSTQAIVGNIYGYLSSDFPSEQESLSKEQVLKLRDGFVENHSLGDDLATFIFHFTLTSLYRRTLEGLTGEVDTSPWRKGVCPVCEEKPHYGKIRKEDGAKILECWLCGTRWQHTRVQCPSCDYKEQEKLGFFTVEDKKVCRVHFCEECNGYYKIFDSRPLEKKEINLYVHHLATLTHDLLAAKEGFSPISGLEWINREELSGVNNTKPKH